MFTNVPETSWARCVAVVRPTLLLAPAYLRECRARLAAVGIRDAVARHDTRHIFDWCARLLARQGISNHAAEVFIERHGAPRWHGISRNMAGAAFCPRLRSYWQFEGCGYRRLPPTCGSPHFRVDCPVAAVPARKGLLAEASIGLWLFVRDVCGGDLVGWIDERLADANFGTGRNRLARMRAAVLVPLTEITGTGSKTWSMILAELLLGADSKRALWVETGASFVAIDSLCHAYFRRTGVLRRLAADHPYGLCCYERGGCASIAEQLARRIDAREFAPENPAYFPRLIQFAIWWFCAADGWDICNANRIDDGVGCQQSFCPSYSACDRLPILGHAPVASGLDSASSASLGNRHMLQRLKRGFASTPT